MPAHYTSYISFVCPVCGEDVGETISVPGTHWSGDTADERYVMDSETVSCAGCDTPLDLEIGNQDGTIFVTLSEYRGVEVKASYAELQSEPVDIDWDVPDEPALILYFTLGDIRTLVEQHGDPEAASVFNRMAFIQQVSAFEAYLGDFLLDQVKNKASVLTALVTGDKELKDRKLSLSEVLADPQAVKRTVAGHLQGQLYHKLDKAEMLYRTALSVALFPNDEIKERLFQAMPIRHDCVHRNGLNKEGVRRGEVTAGFLRQMDADVRAVAAHLESRID